jgi:hypothetical protein
MVQFALLGSEASFNVPQTLAVRQLSKCHTEVLVEAGEILHLEVAIVPVDAFVKNMERKMLHHLREYEFSSVHGCPPCAMLHKDCKTSGKISSR